MKDDQNQKNPEELRKKQAEVEEKKFFINAIPLQTVRVCRFAFFKDSFFFLVYFSGSA